MPRFRIAVATRCAKRLDTEVQSTLALSMPRNSTLDHVDETVLRAVGVLCEIAKAVDEQRVTPELLERARDVRSDLIRATHERRTA